MNWLMLVMVVVTSIFLIVSFVQDIKERTVFSFPCLVLIDAWAIVLWNVVSYRKAEVICFLVIHSVLFILMKVFKVWGDGDSDMFLLFANICLVCVPASNIIALAITECLLLIASIAISIGIGAIEYRCRKRKFALSGDMAVIPGFSIVLIVVMAIYVIGRFM